MRYLMQEKMQNALLEKSAYTHLTKLVTVLHLIMTPIYIAIW